MITIIPTLILLVCVVLLTFQVTSTLYKDGDFKGTSAICLGILLYHLSTPWVWLYFIVMVSVSLVLIFKGTRNTK